MRKRLRNLLRLTLLVLLLSSALCAQEQLPHELPGIERYLNIRAATGPALAPQGDRTAFLTNITGTAQVWMINATGGWPEQTTFYPDRIDFISWAPDGSGLVFAKSIGGDENAQLFWLAPDGSQVRTLTAEPKVRHNFGVWSADGRQIAYSSNKRAPNFFDVYVMDIKAGRAELIYQQDGSNAAVGWSRDGKQLVVSRENEQLSLDNDLYLVDVASRKATHLTPHEGAAQFRDVRFLPDGKSILLTTNSNGEFQSLAQMQLSTKKIEILDNTQWDVGSVEVSDHGGMLAYTVNNDGFSELYKRRLETDGKPLITTVGPASPIRLPGKGLAGGLSFSHDGNKLALVFNGPKYNPDVWLYDLASRALKQVTHSSRGGISQSSFIEPQLVRYKSFDGRMIPAWYYQPRTVTPVDHSLPVILSVHGGPEGQARPNFNAVFQYFLSRGYAILDPNVRGSTGYGKTYTHLDDLQKREDSVKDLSAGVEWLKTDGAADPKRIGIMGGSYGGYMVLAAITLYPEIWSAAVDMFGIANFETFLRRTSNYRRKLREREYGTLDRDLDFLGSISPINKVDRIRAPLFVLHGRNDPRVPFSEAEQIVKALEERKQPVEHIYFDDEGHGFVKLNNRLYMYPKIVEFFERYMSGGMKDK
ncbi:MAG TPA: S9 family peptidase [Pyrinomonadaceae bacterium]|nr:S9 family peptidase [Pyrinomonadaceae bacterium]